MDNDVVRWRHGPGNTLLAEINKQTDRITVYDDVLDGRFRDRLKLDNQTGSLTITDPRHEHAGVYELEGKSLRKSFSLVIIDEISMKEGDSLTLNSGLTEIKDDEIQWKLVLEDILIAKIKKQTNNMTVYDDVLDGRFRNRLKLDNQTGSLTITNTTTQHAGAYELLINNVRKRFFLAVYDEISVKEGDSLTLNSGRTEISKGEMFVWLYLNEIGFIAGIKAWDDNIPEYDDVLDGRFRDRLKLDNQTGSLTITNFTTEHNGVYYVAINRMSIHFFLAVYDEISVTEGDSVTLNCDLTKMKAVDQIQWSFSIENILIAGIIKRTERISVYDDVLDGRFRDRLKLNKQTLSLTITNITTQHAGVYQLSIFKSKISLKAFRVSVYGE
uniref:Immunoglobulin domain-containing protein n=1 Tax=Cyprinus carpio TaxID=7962 RepID=A0A8C1ZJ32_CYPCA